MPIFRVFQTIRGNMKYFAITLIFLFSIPVMWSQNSDCNTAISVCSQVYEQNNSPAGTGNVFEQSPFSCQTFGEFNSAWYVFTVQQDGVINFLLEPNNLNDDYDWSLYEITDGGCAGINSGLSPEVSCNSYGETFGQQGVTGISSALGGVGSSNGPGNLAGPPINADLNVSQGEVYALVVMNYSATLNGYGLDFAGSTAEIYDDTPPMVENVEINCEHNAVSITLSEYISPTYLTAANFSMLLGGANVPITNVTFPAGEFTNSFTINSPQLATEAGAVELIFNNPPVDLCGNQMDALIPFEIALPPEVVVAITNACEGSGGAVEIAVNNNNECVEFSVDPSISTTSTCEDVVLNDLAPGSYAVSIFIPSSGCIIEEIADVINSPLPVSLGMNQELCDLQGVFSVTTTATEVQWTGDTGLFFSSPNNSATSILANSPGTYTVTVIATAGLCENTDSFEITFNTPPAVQLTTSPITCFEGCDGEVTIWDESNTTISVEVDGQAQTGEQLTFEGLCSGEYAATVIFSPQCTATYTFELDNPSPVQANFTMDPQALTVNNSDVFLIAETTNADSLFWSVQGLDDFTSNDSIWLLELPAVPAFYAIQLVAMDANGCTTSLVRQIQVKDDLYVYTPSAFTPNNDDLNDFFLPILSYQPEYYELIIFDRWGARVFESKDWKQAWMGDIRSNGFYSESTVFNWVLKVKGTGLEILEFTGSVTLLR